MSTVHMCLFSFGLDEARLTPFDVAAKKHAADLERKKKLQAAINEKRAKVAAAKK